MTSETKDSKRDKNPDNWKEGDLIRGEFRIMRILRGGMGLVYIVRQNKTNITLALKTIKTEFIWNPHIFDMFIREAELWVKLEKHPNIVQAYFVQEIKSKPFIFLEYIDGTNLEALLEKGPLPIRQALKFAIQISRAVTYAFEKLNIMHRDLKPSNCLITKDGVLKLSDFGLARVTSQETFSLEENEHLVPPGAKESHASAIQGTLPYMSPESFNPKNIVTIQSDMYSFGAVLYEMLIGKPPIPGSNIGDFLVAHEKYIIADPATANPEIPAELSAVILKCLDPKPEKRFGSFNDILEKLENLYAKLYRKRYTPITENFNELSAENWHYKGSSMAYLNRHYEAIRCFREAYKKEPSSTAVLSEMGDSFHAIGMYREAVECYDKYLKRKSLNAAVTAKKGESYAALGKKNLARICFDKAITLDGENEYALTAKGIFLINNGDIAEGSYYIDKALKHNPIYIRALKEKSRLLSQAGHFSEALKNYDIIHLENNRDIVSWLEQGKIFANLGKYSDAITCFSNVLRLAPGNKEAWFALQQNKILAGKFNEVRNEISSALEKSDSDAEILGLSYALALKESDFYTALGIASQIEQITNSNLFSIRAIKLMDILLIFEEALVKAQTLFNQDLKNFEAQKLCLRIAERKNFYSDYFQKTSTGFLPLPAGDNILPTLSKKERNQLSKAIKAVSQKKITQKPDVYYQLKASESLNKGQDFLAFHFFELSAENSDSPSAIWLKLAQHLENKGFLSNALHAYNKYAATSKNTGEAWKGAARIYASNYLYAEALFFASKALLILPADPVLYLSAIFYAQRAGLLYMVPAIAMEALKKLTDKNYITDLVRANLYIVLKRSSEVTELLAPYIKQEGLEGEMALLICGKSKLYRNNYEKAEEYLSKISDASSLIYEKSYYLGLVYEKKLHFASAKSLFEKASFLAPGKEADISLAGLLGNTDSMQHLENHLTQLNIHPSKKADMIIFKIYFEYKNGRLDKALKLASETLKSIPTNYEIQLARLILSIDMDAPFAIRQIDRYIKEYPIDPRPFALKSYSRLKNGSYDAAEHTLIEGLKIHPYSSTLLNNMAGVLIQKNNFEKAEQVLKEAEEFEKNNFAIYGNLAICRLREKDLTASLALTNEALALTPRNKSLIYIKLYTMFFLKDYKEIAKLMDLQEAQIIAGKSFEIIGCVSEFISKNYNKAQYYADLLLEKYPEYSVSWMLNALLLEKKGAISQATLAYRNSISLANKNFFSLCCAGRLLYKNGIREEGLKLFKKGKQLMKEQNIRGNIKNRLIESIKEYIHFPEFILSKPELTARYIYSITENEIILTEKLSRKLK